MSANPQICPQEPSGLGLIPFLGVVADWAESSDDYLGEPSRRVTIRVSARHYEAIQAGGAASGFNFSAFMEAIVQLVGDAWLMNGSRHPEEWDVVPDAWRQLGVDDIPAIRAYWDTMLRRVYQIEEARRKAGGRPKGKTRRAIEAALERDEEEGDGGASQAGSIGIGRMIGCTLMGLLYLMGDALT